MHSLTYSKNSLQKKDNWNVLKRFFKKLNWNIKINEYNDI